MARDEFAHYIADLLSPLGSVRPRGMFGGYGIYRDGLMFALVADDTLYFCADDGMRAAFGALGTGPFRYQAKGREITIGRYHEVPAAILDDADDLIVWARVALRAAAVPAATARRKRAAAPRSLKSDR